MLGASVERLTEAVRADLRGFGQEAKTALRAHVLQRIAEHIDPLLDKQFELAQAGDARILISLLDRAIDRPTEHHEITAHAVPLFAIPATDDVSTANPQLLENRRENAISPSTETQTDAV